MRIFKKVISVEEGLLQDIHVKLIELMANLKNNKEYCSEKGDAKRKSIKTWLSSIDKIVTELKDSGHPDENIFHICLYNKFDMSVINNENILSKIKFINKKVIEVYGQEFVEFYEKVINGGEISEADTIKGYHIKLFNELPVKTYEHKIALEALTRMQKFQNLSVNASR